MTANLKSLILRLLGEHRVMTIATNRADGLPKATMVGYVNDGFLLYCFVARNSQKYSNIQRDSRVSVAIGSDAANPMDIKGLSLGGHATEVTDPAEFEYVAKLRLQRYPEYAILPPTPEENASQRISRRPLPAGVALFRIAPDNISVLDYSKGFGHSDLVTFSDRDLDVHIDSLRHRWRE
jgi:nitroimidazol reductase NimA-like FMN-containing flavoprotein (pyridoxamine 5'-phosphate oxidase superfamily)